MEEYTRYVWLVGGDPVKLARMLEIRSWFDNPEKLVATVKGMAKYLEKSKKEAIRREGVVQEYIELLLWAMEQSDSPDSIVRLQWWEYQSKMEHPLEIEGSSNYTVLFVRVSWQSEPMESSSAEPNYKRRKTVGAMMLPRHLVTRGGCLPPRNRRVSPIV